MLDSHPDLWIASEPRFIVPLVRRRRRYGRGRSFRVQKLADDIVDAQSFRRLNLSEGLLRTSLETAEVAGVEDAIRALFAAGAADAGKRRWGLKSPDDVLHVRQLAAAFPEARFIHVIRDGRDVSLSLRSLPKAPTAVAEAASYWQHRVERGRHAGRALPADRYMELRYEDLVADPAARLRAICDFLDIGFDPAMLAYHRRSAEVLAGNAHPELHDNLRRPPTVGTRDWRQEMSPPDVATFESLAGRLLHELGYEVGDRAAPVRVRMIGFATRTRQGWRRARHDALDRLKAMTPSR